MMTPLINSAFPDSPIINVIRNPIDMLSSKKNMLLFHIHGEANPIDYEMNHDAINNVEQISLRRSTGSAASTLLAGDVTVRLVKRMLPIN